MAFSFCPESTVEDLVQRGTGSGPAAVGNDGTVEGDGKGCTGQL